MPPRLYHIPLSPPGLSVQGALARKGIDYKLVELLGGLHPPVLKALRFKGVTVPAMKLADGTRVQGSLDIMRALERIQADPPLFPADPAARAAVEEAERWGESVLQHVPRRMIRWTLKAKLSQRQWYAGVSSQLPLPKVMGAALTPVVPFFVRQAHAYDDDVRADCAGLPGHLDRIDALIADGVIGAESAPNAADFQIAGSLAALSAFVDLRSLFEDRPCLELTRRLMPGVYPPVPAALPAKWLPVAA